MYKEEGLRYHGDPRVPESESQHHVSGECGHHGYHHPDHIPPRLIHHKAQERRCRGGDDVDNAGKERTTSIP